MTIDASGNFWVSDEYGPWITKFSPTGQTLERVGPYAANGSGHKLPKVFAKRTPGRGMESMTLSTDGTKLIGLMQSGLMTGGITTESNGKKVAAVRILVYTIASGACEEYAYVLDTESGTKRLVACSVYPDANGTDYYVLERDGDAGVAAGIKRVYKFAFGAATNLNDSMGDSADGTLFGGFSMETVSSAAGTTANSIANLTGAGITPVTKTLVKDLTPLCDAYPHDKWEGLTVRSDGKLIIANDDDFGITGTDSLGPKTLLGTSAVDFNQFMEVDPTKMLTATGTITVTVSVVNTAPTITDVLNLSTNEDTATSAIGFVIGDVQTAAASLITTATSSNTTLVPNGNLVISGTGSARSLVATPAANLNGTSTITVTVSDGALTATDTFVVTVTAVNDVPVAIAGTATVVAGAAVNGSVTATDADSGATLTYSKVADPTKGTVTVNPNGTFTYTANPGTSGTDTFTFKANDTFADSNVATVTVTITAPPAPPVAPPASSNSSSGCGLGGGVGALVLAIFVGLKGLFLRRRS